MPPWRSSGRNVPPCVSAPDRFQRTGVPETARKGPLDGVDRARSRDDR